MKTRQVYWAGDLFDIKHLIGNRMLADAFDRQAAGRWQAVLPQENESNAARPDAIRDDDLEKLFSADAVVANFDGTDLDSGTVVEFCFAKFLDLPTVQLRTDFRNSNDPVTCPEPWNLMCSSYPRTETLCYHALKMSATLSWQEMLDDLAKCIVEKLDLSTAQTPLFADADAEFAAFRHAVCAAGGSMPQRFPDERLRSIIAAKRQA